MRRGAPGAPAARRAPTSEPPGRRRPMRGRTRARLGSCRRPARASPARRCRRLLPGPCRRHDRAVTTRHRRRFRCDGCSCRMRLRSATDGCTRQESSAHGQAVWSALSSPGSGTATLVVRVQSVRPRRARRAHAARRRRRRAPRRRHRRARQRPNRLRPHAGGVGGGAVLVRRPQRVLRSPRAASASAATTGHALRHDFRTQSDTTTVCRLGSCAPPCEPCATEHTARAQCVRLGSRAAALRDIGCSTAGSWAPAPPDMPRAMVRTNTDAHSSCLHCTASHVPTD